MKTMKMGKHHTHTKKTVVYSKSVLRGNFIVIQAHLSSQEKYQISNLILDLTNQRKKKAQNQKLVGGGFQFKMVE